MNRNVTAVYRTYSVADLVRAELEDYGLSRSDIHVIPDSDLPAGTSGEREDRRWSDALHDLDLPDEDMRTYQSCVRRGDYVVSANVDESDVERVQQIMRRPEAEAYDLDARDAEFRDETIHPHSDDSRTAAALRAKRRRDPAYTDPYLRAYRRDER
jgi:hypothetical protein